MNKKTIFIALVAALVLGLLAVGITSAQGGPPPIRGMLGRSVKIGIGPGQGGGPGMGGPMHEAMLNALAEGLGLTRTELDARMAAGETPHTIALAQGLTDEEFWALMQAARATAIAQAVAAGTLTQAQADQMLSHNMAGGMGMGASMNAGAGMGAGMRGNMMGTGTCPYMAATPAP